MTASSTMYHLLRFEQIATTRMKEYLLCLITSVFPQWLYGLFTLRGHGYWNDPAI